MCSGTHSQSVKPLVPMLLQENGMFSGGPVFGRIGSAFVVSPVSCPSRVLVLFCDESLRDRHQLRSPSEPDVRLLDATIDFKNCHRTPGPFLSWFHGVTCENHVPYLNEKPRKRDSHRCHAMPSMRILSLVRRTHRFSNAAWATRPRDATCVATMCRLPGVFSYGTERYGVAWNRDGQAGIGSIPLCILLTLWEDDWRHICWFVVFVGLEGPSLPSEKVAVDPFWG